MNRREQLLMAASQFRGTRVLARTFSGVLVRYGSASQDPTHPFNIADWSTDARLVLSLDAGGNLKIDGHPNSVIGTFNIICTPVAPRADVFIQAACFAFFPDQLGGGMAARSDGDIQYAASSEVLYLMAFFSGKDLIREISEGATVSEFNPATGFRGAGGGATGQLLVELNTAKCFVPGAPTSEGTLAVSAGRISGDVGLVISMGAAQAMGCSQFIACASRYVQVNSVAPGSIVKVRKNDGTTIVQAAAGAEGYALVDFYKTLLNYQAFDVAIYSSDGVTLLDSIAPAGGVWPGDIYDYILA